MVNIDFNLKTVHPQPKRMIEDRVKTRKEIRKEKICKRCGLEAKKLYNTKTISPLIRAIGKIDWVSISINTVVASFLSLLIALVILEILRKK